MATATYVVDSSDWDETAGPTGYERARVFYGPMATRGEAVALMEHDYDDDGLIVEMDRGEECPAPWNAPDPERDRAIAREEFDRRGAELAEFWAKVPADRRLALDIECGGLIQVLDAFRNAHAALPEEV